MKKIYLLFLPFFIFSQDCYDDNYTMQVGLSVWTSGIVGCEDGISFLEDAGYPCNTPLSTLNNPFWGSNPNETLFNICSCISGPLKWSYWPYQGRAFTVLSDRYLF